MAAVEFRVLGPLEVIGPRGLIKIGSARQRAVLALLVLNLGETVTTDRLIDEVWGDDAPRSARHALEVHVFGLRRALGPDRLETQPHGYRLRVEGSNVDLGQFQALVADASHSLTAGDPEAASAFCAAALALWRGPALGDLGASGAARAERTRLDELRLIVVERRIDAELACGRHLDLVPELLRIVDEMPLRESFQARLMLALYRSGRQADALLVYLRAREVLDRELGIQPGQELDQLQRAVLDHDPSLSVAGAIDRLGSSARIADPESPATHPGHGRETRRTVTLLRAEASATTVGGEPLDPETGRQPRARYFEAVRRVIERHGGKAQSLVGDAQMAIFGVPVVHEDDALRAVRAAAEIRTAVGSLNEGFERDFGVRLETRIGLDTGEVIANDAPVSHALVMGDAVNTAARLAQTAAPGDIVLGASTYRLVERVVDAIPTEPIAESRRSTPITAFRLISVHQEASGRPPRHVSPFVGRERERRLLDAALEQVKLDETCQIFSLLGPAGVGKSRLVHEFLGSARADVAIVRGRCLPYGERVALWPVAESIKQGAGIGNSDPAHVVRLKIAALVGEQDRAAAIVERIAAVLGASEAPTTSEDTFWAIRIVYETLARQRPLIVAFDDVQWGEPVFLDLVDYIAGVSRGAPILLVCIARPELLDERPGWAGGQLDATSLLLRPLADAEVSQLVRNLLGDARPSPALARKIRDAADGNPLFVEEFLSMLIEDGVIRLAGDEWVTTTDLATIAVPASITALVAARLDRLPDVEREVVSCAAIVGKVFTRNAVEALLSDGARPSLDRRLGSLVRRELIRPARTAPEGQSYRFKHILIRDAAYAALPKRERAVLHERLADWLTESGEGGVQFADEVIGAHLEKAYGYRTELGPLDDGARAVGRQAAGRLSAAGRRAHLWGDPGVAEDLLGRAIALLPAGDRERLLLLVDLTETFFERGEVVAARTTNDELMLGSRLNGLEDLQWRAILDRMELDFYEAIVSPDLPEDVRRAIHFFDGIGDERALALAWALAGAVDLLAGHLGRSRSALAEAAEHARRAGDVRRQSRSLVFIASSEMDGPATVATALRTAEELLDWARASGHLWTEAIALAHIGRLEAMVGRFNQGRRLVNEAIAIQRQLGRPLYDAVDISRWIGMVEWLAGDPVAAEQGLMMGYGELELRGSTQGRMFLAPELARVVYEQGRFDEAYEYTRAAEAGGADILVENAMGWRGVRGMVLARRGDVSAALEVAREAVGRGEPTDLVWFQGRAFEDLAEVLELAGRRDEARPIRAKARGLYDQKGITVLADRVRQRETALQR